MWVAIVVFLMCRQLFMLAPYRLWEVEVDTFRRAAGGVMLQRTA